MHLTPFLRIDDQLSLHLARPELVEPVFSTVDAHREYLRMWLPWVDGTQKVEDTRKFIRESMRHNSDGTRLTTFILKGEEVAGSVGVIQFDRDHKSCEIGYWLREDLQGKGIMTKACACLIDHLFKTKDINRIEIKVNVENVKSQKIPYRLGFTCEGTLRQVLYMYNTFHDLKLFSMLKKEWKGRESKK